VRTEVDASLLGGVIVKIGNKIIDDSLRTKIGNFKKELTKIQSI
jgi:F0F1-type ATP synthase delta subunit